MKPIAEALTVGVLLGPAAAVLWLLLDVALLVGFVVAGRCGAGRSEAGGGRPAASGRKTQ